MAVIARDTRARRLVAFKPSIFNSNSAEIFSKTLIFYFDSAELTSQTIIN